MQLLLDLDPYFGTILGWTVVDLVVALLLIQCAEHVHYCIRFVRELECGPMPNVMAAQPSIGGALCESSVGLIPFLVPRRKIWLRPAAGVPCSNADNIRERKTWTQSEYCMWQIFVRGQKCIHYYGYNIQPHKNCVLN